MERSERKGPETGICVRPCTEAEYHQFFRGYEADPVMEPMPFKYNQETVSRSYQYNCTRENYAQFGIFLDGGKTIVGCFQLKRMDTARKRCEFGIILQSDAVKDQGIGTEAIRQGMEAAREKYGMKTVTGDTASGNHRMIRVFEKLRFRLVETVPNAYLWITGRPEDRLVYERSLDQEE